MLYNKIEQVLVITKLIFNYYNTDFLLEMTSKVQQVSQKSTFTQADHQTLLSGALFISLPNHHGMERTGLSDIKGRQWYIYAAFRIRSEEGTSGDSKWSRI